jgi:hypothetical protein
MKGLPPRRLPIEDNRHWHSCGLLLMGTFGGLPAAPRVLALRLSPQLSVTPGKLTGRRK